MFCSNYILQRILPFLCFALCACPSADKGGETGEPEDQGPEAPIIHVDPADPAEDDDTGDDDTDDDDTGDDDAESTVGELESMPGRSCADILSRNPEGSDGTYWIDPNGDGAGAFQVACDQTTDGGGWTLVMVTSDDGQTTWTWNDRHLLDTDDALVGDLANRDHDYKSEALHTLAMSDLLFVHHPSEIWASYHDVGDGSGAFADAIALAGAPTCYDPDTDGYEMSAGTLTVSGDLCSTRLYLNPADWDGTTGCAASNHSDAYGPAWSANSNFSCPFDDPGSISGVGPNAGARDGENQPADGSLGLGFGQPLDLNTGALGTGENHLDVFVR